MYLATLAIRWSHAAGNLVFDIARQRDILLTRFKQRLDIPAPGDIVEGAGVEDCSTPNEWPHDARLSQFIKARRCVHRIHRS